MSDRLAESGLAGLRGTVQQCADCGRATVHFRVVDGWPVCHACGLAAPQVGRRAEAETKSMREVAAYAAQASRQA